MTLPPEIRALIFEQLNLSQHQIGVDVIAAEYTPRADFDQGTDVGADAER